MGDVLSRDSGDREEQRAGRAGHARGPKRSYDGLDRPVGFSNVEYILACSEFDLALFEKIFRDGACELGAAVVGAHNDTVKNYEALVKQGVWADQYGEINAFRWFFVRRGW